MQRDVDDRPVVHVDANNFYFNITFSATFQDIIFDGINAFASFQRVNQPSTGALKP